MQQTIPVQVPITSSNGQTVYQTVHFPVQAFATAAVPNIIQAQGNQMQIIPQLAQVRIKRSFPFRSWIVFSTILL